MKYLLPILGVFFLLRIEYIGPVPVSTRLEPMYYFDQKQTVNKPIWHDQPWIDNGGGLRPGQRYE